MYAWYLAMHKAPASNIDPTCLRLRKRVNDAVRSFFDQRGFLEVETPILVPSPGLECHLDAFATQSVVGRGQEVLRYLHTSPEYAMKRLIASGCGDILSAGTCISERRNIPATSTRVYDG